MDISHRNQFLNSAYQPKWAPVPDSLQGINQVPMGANGDTNFDPFIGSQWGQWLDAMGAKDPGGIKSLKGLR